MHPIWDNGETGELVLKLRGKQNWLRMQPSVRSVVDRTEFARYHYHETLGLLNSFVEENLRETSLLEVSFFRGDEYGEFSNVMLQIRAHVTATIQSLHAIPDTCAHMLYYSPCLNETTGIPRSRGITSKSVLKQFEGKPELAKLHVLFSNLSQGQGFEHLNALANHAKHRSIVRPSLNEDWTGKRTEKHVLLFESFEYDQKPFPSVDVREFIQGEFDRIQPLTVDIGVELNNVLRNRLC